MAPADKVGYLSLMRVVALIVVGFAVACSPVPAGVDAGSVPDDGGVTDSGLVDGGEVREVTDAGAIDAGAPPCALDGERLSCTHRTFEVPVASPLPLTRVVHVGVPRGVAPPSGWPTVFLFQGSLFSAQLTWGAQRADPLGAFWQTSTVQALLDAGFAVVTPEVRLFGASYWDTNVPQWSVMWTNSPDHHFMVALLDGVTNKTFGPLDGTRLYAGGISSGGYMTSRMALSYAGRFKALAVHSASWATCAGPLCILPATLPADHPPTLFLHGEKDAIVSIATMRTYEAKLRAQGVETRVATNPDAAHEWLELGVTELRDFFRAHP